VHIKWTEAASEDLNIIHTYISNDNPIAAVDVILHIIQSVEDLIPQNPAVGRTGRILGTRELIITNYPYIVPYRVVDSEIEIIRVLHTSLKWPDNF
jgi:toxin ParE1/3/4